MFITRPPFQQKRNFNFSSTLAGKIYNNKHFLSSCSFLETEIKLSTAGSQEDQLRLNSQKRFSLANNDIRKAGALSVAQKSGNHSGGTRRLSVTDRKTAKLIRGDETAINVSQTAFAIMQQVIPSKKPQRKLKRKLAFNPQTDPFYSPFVYIRLIDKINDLKEVENKSIRVNFEKIYKKLIKTQLMGEFTANFMETVERYIREIIQANEMYCNPFEIQLQPELTTISRKDQFLQQIVQLWSEGNNLKLHELIKFYCIPKESTSEKMLQDLLEQLRMESYQKKSCNRDIEYVLMTDEGVQIKHISEIYFSTMQLLMAPKESANIDYEKYRYLLEQRDKSLKMTMRQSIKHHFVQRIVASRIQNKLINYQPNPQQYTQYRRQAVEQATVLLQSKSKLRLQARRNQKQLSQDFDMFQDHSSRDDDLFTNFVLRKQKEKKQYHAILEKLRKILDPKHIYQIRSRLDEKTEEQFQKLHLFNDKYDITYNHHPQNNSRMFLINLIENSSIFNTKTTQQLEKLLNMLESVYGAGMDNLNQIQFWQFKEIYETAHGVADKSIITKFVINYLNFDEFGEMSKKQFYNMIEICLPGIGRPQRMAKEILWNYLERMKLIENNALLRIKIQIWYEPVRIIFLLFLSIIFGGNYESIEQMIQDLLNHLD